MRVSHNGLVYEIRPDDRCWILCTIRVRGEDSKTPGAEYAHDVVFPSTLPNALESLLDRMVRDGLEPDATLAETVATVAHLYATVGRAVEESPHEA